MRIFEQLEQEGAQSIQQATSFEKKFRDEAWAQHLKVGWPSLKAESWHYSNSNELLKSSLNFDTVDSKISAKLNQLIEKYSGDFEVLTFLNGDFQSQIFKSPSGLRVSSIQDHWQKMDEMNIAWSDGLSSALAARTKKGLWIDILPESKLKKPILILHFNEQGAAAVHDFKVISVNNLAHCSVCEVYLSGQESLQFSQTIIQLHPNSRLQYGRLLKQESSSKHYSETQIFLKKNAELKALTVNLGLDWSKGVLVAQLDDQSAVAYLSGIGFGMLKQHNDQRVETRHQVGHSKSRQLYKGILRDQARGILNGKIFIAKGANQVDSAQLNHNLLLSSLAEVDTKPELEVYADDVKANHGASIGRLDEEKLFYFSSRGISRSEATQILAQGFVSDVLAKIDNQEIRNLFSNEIKEILPKYSEGLTSEGVQ